MKPYDAYHKFVRWSDEDQASIGYCPDLYFGGICHGDDETEVYQELCQIVRDEVAHRLAMKWELPSPSVRVMRDLEGAAP
jgi:hypothetical protein